MDIKSLASRRRIWNLSIILWVPLSVATLSFLPAYVHFIIPTFFSLGIVARFYLLSFVCPHCGELFFGRGLIQNTSRKKCSNCGAI